MAIKDYFGTIWEANKLAISFASIALILFFPLDWIDGFINITIVFFVSLGNLVFGGLFALFDWILGGLAGLIEGLLDTIAGLLNAVIPFGDPFDTTNSVDYGGNVYTPIVSPVVDVFLDGSTFFGLMLGAFGVALPFGV